MSQPCYQEDVNSKNGYTELQNQFYKATPTFLRHIATPIFKASLEVFVKD